jgi:diaminopimelate epimerase
MTGSGNDFVMIDGRVSGPEDWTAEEIRAVCARGTGVGADGLVFVAPGSAPGAVRMVYLNSDGSRAAMCGNAALCSARLATRLGLAPDTMLLETDAGTYHAHASALEERARLGLAPIDPPLDVPGLVAAPGEERAALALVGVPHLVVMVADVERVRLAARGPVLRRDPALGPEGANVNYISRGPAPGEWRMRTYERGVEDETLACGTGAVAAACALERWGLTTFPVTLITRSGRPMDVHADKLPSGQYEKVSLTGEARLVFRGVLG